MKNIYKSLVAIITVAVFALSSCNTDLLDVEQQGVTAINTYQTADDAQVTQYIAAIYAFTMGDAYQAMLAGGPACYRAIIYELSRMGAESANYYPYTESADAKTYSYIWAYYYRIAYWCNMIIENLPANDKASESVKNQVIAEARAMRAFAMMNLVQLYGNPPLADHVLDGSEGNTPAAQSWEFIESELTEAANGLPSKSGLDGQSAIGGRLTKEAAYACLGKAYLWQKKYNEAANTLYSKVIATNKYELIDNFETLNSSAADFSAENIWEYDFDDDPDLSGSQEGCFDLIYFSAGCPMWFFKYGSLFMAFGSGAYPAADFAQFMEQHDGKSSPRYQATLMDYGTASMMGAWSTPLNECEGYIKVKDLVLAEDLVGNIPYWYSKRNMVYMRYAETLLNYAEAVAQGGQAGAMSGLEALNKVRRRSGLTDAPALDMNNPEYGVKAERRAELYCEGHRFIDLVRWGDAAQTLADCGKLKYVFMGINASTGAFDISTSSTGGVGFKSGKNELFPIPSSDRSNNPDLGQNPGW